MTSNMKGGSKQGTIKSVVEEIVPSFCWSDDPISHYLLVDLPGFKREEVKLQIDNNGNIQASGERQVIKENKIIRFKQTFKAPEDSEKDKTSGKFEGEILYVIVPKKKIKRDDYIDEEGSKGKGDEETNRDPARRERKETGKVMEMMKKNKGIVITAVLAFSLGVLVSKIFLIGSDQSSNE